MVGLMSSVEIGLLTAQQLGVLTIRSSTMRPISVLHRITSLSRFYIWERLSITI